MIKVPLFISFSCYLIKQQKDIFIHLISFWNQTVTLHAVDFGSIERFEAKTSDRSRPSQIWNTRVKVLCPNIIN